MQNILSVVLCQFCFHGHVYFSRDVRVISRGFQITPAELAWKMTGSLFVMFQNSLIYPSFLRKVSLVDPTPFELSQMMYRTNDLLLLFIYYYYVNVSLIVCAFLCKSIANW